MQDEIWKTHPYHTDYEISNLGRVKRRTPAKGTRPGLIMRQTTNRFGYRKIGLMVNGKQKLISVHTLVLETFVGPKPDGYICNHKDGVKAKNQASNLEWVTYAENTKHAITTGLKPINPDAVYRQPKKGRPTGERVGTAKLTNEDVLQIKELLAKGFSQRKIAKMFKVAQCTITDINKKRTWQHI